MSTWKRNTAIESRSPMEWWVRYTSPSGIYYWFHESSGWVTEPNQINQPLYQTRGEAYHAMETAPPPPESEREPLGTVWHTTEKGRDIVSMHDYQYRAHTARIAELEKAIALLRAECKAGRVVYDKNHSYAAYLNARAATDAANALEEK